MLPAKRIRQQKALTVAWNLMHLIQCYPNIVKPSSSWSDSIPLKTSTTLYAFNPLNAELNPICHLLALLGGATIVVVSRLRVKHFFATEVQNQSSTVTPQEHIFCRVHRRPSASRLWFTQLSARAVVTILMQNVTIRVMTPCSPVGPSNSSLPWNSEMAQQFLTNKFVCSGVAVVTLYTPSADTAWTECC